jgi:hypothetical protein
MNDFVTPNWDALIGQVVVVDTSSPYVYLGVFSGRQGDFLLLADADAHDLRDTQTSREKYVLDCRRFGVHPNRKWVWVSLREVVGVSRLVDVVEC